MPNLSEEQALKLLNGNRAITYDDLDDIFHAMDFVSTLRGNVIWYRHRRYDVGEFRAEERYDFSTVPEPSLSIARRMINLMLDRRSLEEP